MRTHAGYTYPHQAGRPRLRTTLTVAALIVVLAILAAAAGVALYIAVQASGNTAVLAVQNRQLRGQVAGLQGQVTGLKSKERSDYTTVAGWLAPMLPLATTQCSQDLTGPKGAAQYWFACSPTNPATSQSSTG